MGFLQNEHRPAKRQITHVPEVLPLGVHFGYPLFVATSARNLKSPSRRVTPARSRYSHRGTAYLRVVPRRSRISATVRPPLTLPSPSGGRGEDEGMASFSVRSRRISASVSVCR